MAIAPNSTGSPARLLARVDAGARTAGFRLSTAFGRLVHEVPAIERSLFGRVDPAHLRRRDHVRTVAALWNISAMDQLDVPWWTWAAIRDVERFLAARPDATAFEWGSGASTFWLARRCASVLSVEHHEGFADHTAPMMARFSNVEVLVRPGSPIDESVPGAAAPIRSEKSGNLGLDFGRYVEAVDERGHRFAAEQYDIIVIDGRARSACLDAALGHLRSGGIIVFDNSDRHRYQPALRAAGEHAAVHRHRGWGPGSPIPWETAIVTGR